MGYPTPIEWTDATWNVDGGCDIHSPGCINCYAQRIAASPRLRNHPLYSGVTKIVKGKPIFNGMLTALPADHRNRQWPIRWGGAHMPRLGLGKPSLVFVDDMSDLFHRDRSSAAIDLTVGPIVYSRHIGQLLTKRADIMAQYFTGLQRSARWLEFPHPIFKRPNFDPAVATFDHAIKAKLWLGFSAERQQEFDARWRRIEPLARAGWQIFISCEPLLGRVRLPINLGNMPRKPWVIAGGESGPESRPAHPDWFRLLRDQCEEQGLPFFFKQWGEFAPTIITLDEYNQPADEHLGEKFKFVLGGVEVMRRFGKKRAGASLDGREHRAFPEVA